MPEVAALELLSGGADAAIIVLFLRILKIEKRIFKMELKLFGFGEGVNDERQK